MKRIIAAVSFALIASPALAQSFDRSPTDPTMPAYAYDPTVPTYDRTVEDRRQFAAAGITRSDVEISTEAPVTTADVDDRHVEREEGYFDPSN